MWSDFKEFLMKANVVALSLAVIVGVAAGALVTAMTNDFIMPIIGAVTPDGDWRKWPAAWLNRFSFQLRGSNERQD